MAIFCLVVGARYDWAATAKRSPPFENLTFIESKMTLWRRSTWTDMVPKPWLMSGAGHYDRLTIHHAGETTNFNLDKNAVIRDLEGVLTEHVERHYGDIGYHFIIDYAGRVWEGRSLAYDGAHVSGQNDNNIAVMLLGNFEKQKPSAAQLASMKQLVELLREHFRIKRYRIYSHRDLGQSACPGRHLYAHVSRLREQL